MFESTDIQAIFSRFQDRRVLVIGDVMVESYLHGQLSADGQDDAHPCISRVVREDRLGGAANVALNVKAMGAVPILCSVIGEDDEGTRFLQLLEQQNLSDIALLVDDHRHTSKMTRIMSGSNTLLSIDEESDAVLGEDMEHRFSELLSGLLNSGGIDALIFQRGGSSLLSGRLVDELSAIAGKMGIPILADPRLSSDPLHQSDYTFTQIPEFPEEEGQHPGAGHTVISVAALCTIAGLEAPVTAAITRLAGIQVSEKPGLVPVDSKKLLEECLHHFKNP